MKSHDVQVKKARALARALDAKRIAGAFVASLAQPPGFWRAPLVAMAAAERVPTHAYVPWKKDGSCRECGIDPAETAEIFGSGNLIPSDLAGMVLVLEAAKRQIAKAPKPTVADKKRMQRVLALVAELPATAREGKLNEALRGEKLVVGSKYDCRHVIETLGACSVLETAEHPGFTTKWTTFAARQARPSSRVECDPPIAFWCAGHGVGAAGVKRWFGHLGIRAPKLTGTRKAEAAKVTAASTASKSRSDQRAARATELVVGDAVALAVGAHWIAGIVTGHFVDRGGKRAKLELVDWMGDAPPAVETLRGLRAVGTRRGTKQSRDPITLRELWKRRDPRRRWVVVGEKLRRPSSDHLTDGPDLSFQGLPDLERLVRDAGLSPR